MTILTIRTDKPDSEIGLYDGESQLAYETWQAHRQLAETIHYKIADLLATQALQLTDIDAIAVYKGPGSFTGLRIGLSVANALAASYNLPIIGETGDAWQQTAISRLIAGATESYVVPEYGADVHITPQKK
jgi:tRNA threonylcarbamoyladenosine biosynthesis protein TsaB